MHADGSVTVAATDAFEETTVDLADQAQAQRKRREAFEAIVHGTYVVDDFRDVLRAFAAAGRRLVLEYVLEGALGPLDLRAENGLLANVHPDEQVGVRQDGRRAVQAPQGAVGL